MNIKMKKISIAVLVILILLLTSCAGPSQPQAVTAEDREESMTKDPLQDTEMLPQETSEDHYKHRLADLVERDFNGKEFRIATDQKEMIFASNSEGFVGKEYYLRNLAVEEKYNVKLTLTEESGTPSLNERLRTEAMAGTDYCDLVILDSPSFLSLASSDCLINLRSVPYLNLNRDFYFEKSLDATTFGSMTYGVAGDFTYNPEAVNVVFFNKTLLSKTALPDLYTLVKENQWDLENFQLYAEEVYSLGKENGIKLHGITSSKSSEDLIKIFWAATGFDFMVNEYGTRPELVFDHEYTRDFLKTYRNLFFKSGAYTTSPQEGSTSFANGEVLFMIAPLNAAEKLIGKGCDWGILPVPKYNINQTAYYSYPEGSTAFAGFTKGTSDTDFSGIITCALFASSEGLNQSLALTSYLNLRFSAQEDAEMMKIIIETPYYDPSEFIGELHPAVVAATQTLIYRVASSGSDFNNLYKQSEKLLEKHLDTIF